MDFKRQWQLNMYYYWNKKKCQNQPWSQKNLSLNYDFVYKELYITITQL